MQFELVRHDGENSRVFHFTRSAFITLIFYYNTERISHLPFVARKYERTVFLVLPAGSDSKQYCIAILAFYNYLIFYLLLREIAEKISFSESFRGLRSAHIIL